jgi:transposase
VKKKHDPKRREVDLHELELILERTRAALSHEEHEKLKAAVDTLAFLTHELEQKGTSIERLRRLLFGPSTESSKRVLGEKSSPDDSAAHGSDEAAGPRSAGHGRNAAAAYQGAAKVEVSHGSLQHGSPCPACERGKVYEQPEPALVLRIQGMAPLRATVYRLQRLRCNACGQVFTADAPTGVGTVKYDESAASMIGLLKYGAGLPFNRLEKLEGGLGIPLPAATQWEVVHQAAQKLQPVYEDLIRQAAQGQVLHNDDTTMKILALDRPPPDERTGVFTSGIVSTSDGQHRIALFFTGRRHAGENLEQVLSRRARDLPLPIQMCDALSRNTSGEFASIVANCLAHGRRQFVDVASRFPEECRYVLTTLKDVYHHDELARSGGLSPEDRLILHQQKSGLLMEALQQWFREQLEEKKVEPNSGLGQAIRYMQKHWPQLTLFLHEAGAPLDNNICERALKKAILHRKNALFYKTETGAWVGDLFMSLIHTAELCGANTFEYLVTMLRHAPDLRGHPGGWMPWNYREHLKG